MLTEEEKKELFRRLDEERKDVSRIKSQLNDADREKEGWFRKKAEIGAEIRNLISQIKANKDKRDKFTSDIKSLKENRDKLNQEIKDKIAKIKGMNSQRKETQIRENPRFLRQKIERMEFSLETEVISFEKEKGLMKKIKDMKKSLAEATQSAEASGQSRALSRDIDHLKDGADDLHKRIQSMAANGQECHENVIRLSKQVDELKSKEKECLEKFKESKKKFSELNSALKDKIKALDEANAKLKENNVEVQEVRKKNEKDILKTMLEAVEEKIRKGEKLTNEDLLVMQRFEDTT